MKAIYMVFLLLCSITEASGQDTLREWQTVMYSRYLVLHQNGHFQEYYHHCTGTTFGQGTHEKNGRKWIFTYDQEASRQPNYSLHALGQRDSIILSFRLAFDSSLYEPYQIRVNNQIFTSWDASFSIPKAILDKEANTLIVHRDTLVFKESLQNWDSINVYYYPPWQTYTPSEKLVLRKKGKYYCESSVSRAINEEKPWKKGKRTKYRTYFLLE